MDGPVRVGYDGTEDARARKEEEDAEDLSAVAPCAVKMR
jgi:hypothetical protein